MMYSAIEKMIHDREEVLKDLYKGEHGYKRMTEKRTAELKAIMEQDEMLNEFKEVRKQLRKTA